MVRWRFVDAALVLGIATFVCVAVSGAWAQGAAKVFRVGYLITAPLDARDAQIVTDAFRQGLRDRGYVEGRNLVIEYRSAEGNISRFRALAAELVNLRVDVIVAANSAAALATRKATNAIPIVAPVMGDPVADGIVASLAHPGGNVTGLTFLGPELTPKRLELLKQTLPKLSRVAALWQPDAFSERTSTEMVKSTEAAARRLGVLLQLVEAKRPDDLERAFETMIARHAEAVIVFPSPMLFSEHRRIVDLALRNRLPLMANSREYVDLGALIAYGASIPDQFRRSAGYVDRILKGAKPADLPVEQPTQFELAVNLRTAKALGVVVPASIVQQADQLIE